MTAGTDLLRIVFSNHGDIEEWKLADPAKARRLGFPREVAAPLIDDHATLFLDLALEHGSLQPVCHEVNGSNGVGSDALTGESGDRARIEAAQTLGRIRDLGHMREDGRPAVPVVTIHAHQHWRFFRTGGEFYPRVESYATELRRHWPDLPLKVRSAKDEPGDERVTVVVGDVPTVCAGLTLDPATRRFLFRGRPVVFLGNPNLLTELIRTGKLRSFSELWNEPAIRVLHGWRLLPAIQDKALQQILFRGTGIRPLRHFVAATASEAVDRARRMLEAGPVVLKPNATSGGAGVHVLVPGAAEDAVRAKVDELVEDCRMKYGDNSESFLFPIRGFEFVRSTGFRMEEGDHLWDLRIGLSLEPGRIQAYPVSLRFTPKPFDPERFHLDRDMWISNVSGRQSSLLKSGMDEEVLAAVGMSMDGLGRVMDECTKWAMKAWDSSARGGGVEPVYEDACEAENPDFYPRHAFHTHGSER